MKLEVGGVCGGVGSVRKVCLSGYRSEAIVFIDCGSSLSRTNNKEIVFEGSCREGDNRRVLEEDPLGSKFHRFVFVVALRNDYIVIWKLRDSEFAFHFGIHHIHLLYFILHIQR